MKILHTVESYNPSTGGMQEVVKRISEHLVKMGHSVTVATSRHPGRSRNIANGASVVEFDISGNIVRGISGDSASYQNYLLNSDFDIITNFAAQQWATDLMLPILQKIRAKKLFVPTGFSALHLPEYSDYFNRMKEWMNLYDMNVFLSDTYQDIEFARLHDIKKYVVIPNGASAEEFLLRGKSNIRQELNIPKNHFLILHVGSHTGVKGHAEAIEIFRRAKINNITFIITGNVFSERCYYSCKLKEFLFWINPLNFLSNKQLLVRSLSREETVALYLDSDLFMFPSNIECSPLVLFECMASRTPFLTADVGNAREIIEWSGAGLLLPTDKDKKGYSHVKIDESVKMLEGIYLDPVKRAVMQDVGFNAWQERFSWGKIAKQYEELYLTLLNRGAF
jgi:glycosyltransferase involved in cell wall biosynthesis